ncbi:MAG: hypothetical protein IPM92_16910 [Saprospiraceae bacterium]|nr:hypothetical protein [Saprospiraceae bacterium]
MTNEFEHSYIPTFLHSYIPTILQSYNPTFLHSYLPTCRLFVLIIISFLLTSCERPESELPYNDYSELAIRTSNGFFLAADRNLNNIVVANRNKIGEWEKFTIQKHHDDKISLRSSDNTFLGITEDSMSQLVAGFKELRGNTYFKIVKGDSSSSLIQDYLNRYLIVDSNFVIRTTVTHTNKLAHFLYHRNANR